MCTRRGTIVLSCRSSGSSHLRAAPDAKLPRFARALASFHSLAPTSSAGAVSTLELAGHVAVCAASTGDAVTCGFHVSLLTPSGDSAVRADLAWRALRLRAALMQERAALEYLLATDARDAEAAALGADSYSIERALHFYSNL